MRPLLDGASITLSVACLVHCLAAPVITAALPALASLLETPTWTHAALLALALPLSLWALIVGYRCHGRRRPLLLGTLGLMLMAAGIVLEEIRLAEISLTVAGATLVALAHHLNLRHLGAPHCSAADACARS